MWKSVEMHAPYSLAVDYISTGQWELRYPSLIYFVKVCFLMFPPQSLKEKEIRKRKTSYQTILGNQIKLLPM
jgi:hypothetical protein